MMRVELHVAPHEGRQQDLAWLAEVTAALHDVHDFVLHSLVVAELESTPTRDMSEEDHQRAVAGRVAEAGSPVVRVRDGSLVLELAQFLDAALPLQVLTGFAVLVSKGPAAVALPNRLREAWYSSAADAVQARQRLDDLRRAATVTDAEDPDGAQPRVGLAPRDRRDRPDDPDRAGSAESPRPVRRQRGRTSPD